VIGVGALGWSAVNCIVGSGIFGLPGIAAAMLGPAAVLAYLLCAVLIGLVGLCLAEVGSRVPSAGGVYGYASAAFGPIVGGVAGTLLWASNSVVANAAVANLFIDTLAASSPLFHGAAARVALLTLLYTILLTINIRGARGAARLSTTLAAIKIAPLVVLIAAGAVVAHASNLQWDAVPPPARIGETAVIVFFAFMGVEGALTASGEVIDPARTVPRAILLALTLVAVLYISLQIVAQGVLGRALANTSTPLVATATEVFGPWGTMLLLAATVLSVVGFLSADILCSPRNLYAMAERGQLPRALAAVHPRFKTPAAAVTTYTAIAALVAWSGSFRQLVIVSTSGTLLLYLICCVGVFPLRRRDVNASGSGFRAPGGVAVPIAASAIIVWMLSTLAWTELAAAAVVSVASAAFYTWQERSRGGGKDAAVTEAL